jgi:hypothetical protein
VHGSPLHIEFCILDHSFTLPEAGRFQETDLLSTTNNIQCTRSILTLQYRVIVTQLYVKTAACNWTVIIIIIIYPTCVVVPVTTHWLNKFKFFYVEISAFGNYEMQDFYVLATWELIQFLVTAHLELRVSRRRGEFILHELAVTLFDISFIFFDRQIFVLIVNVKYYSPLSFLCRNSSARA